MSKYFLTGANGFIGSHILQQLLALGSTVCAAVRSQEIADRVRQDHPDAGGRLDFAIIPDITLPGAFEKGLLSSSPVNIVIHTASLLQYGPMISNHDFLDPAVLGTAELLQSIKHVAPSVRRVVLTGSCEAVIDFNAPITGGRLYTNQDWNPVTWAEALGTQNQHVAYQASKKYAEIGAWEFIERDKPHFDLVVLCPSMVYGPLCHTIDSISDLNESNARIWRHFFDSLKDAELPSDGVHLYVDVRDLACAHILSAKIPAAGNKRFLIAAGKVGSQTICDILRKHFPALDRRCPLGYPGTSSLPEDAYDADISPAKEVLGLTFRPAEDTFVDLGRQLFVIEKLST